MDGQQLAGAGNQASPLAIGLSGPTFFSNLMSSVAPDNQNGGLNLIDIPLTLSAFNSYQSNITFATSDDLLVSSINVPISSLPDASFYRMADGSFVNSSDTMLKKECKSPINIVVTTDGIQIQGPVSPVTTSQANQSTLQFQSVVRGGDKMLSAVNSLNFNDSEMLGDSAFDSTSSSGLVQFDDGLLSGLGSAGQGMRLGDGTTGTSFDLFDGEVTDNLSLSPQPFSDTGLMPDTPGVMDTGLLQQSTDSLLDNTMKLTTKKGSGPIQSPDLVSGQGKCGSSQCPLCGKTFSNINALSKHRLTHSDERKYVCNICSKGFKRQDHLNGHLMTHLDKKPYECQLPNCDKGYCDARSLRRHLEQHHHLDPDTVQTHVQASMAAAGISPPAPRNGSKKSGDGRSKQLSSPVYSPGSATPTPSPGAAGAGNVFHFDAQQTKNSQQQKQPHEILVQQIHQQQKLLLQQQKQQQQQQQEEKAKEHNLQASDAVSQHLQLQLQLQQQQQQQQQQQNLQQPDVLAVIQQVQQQLDVQKKKAAAAAAAVGSGTAAADMESSTVMSQDTNLSWPDKAGVYTFVGTPTSSELSPASRSDQSPGGMHVPGEMPVISPVSPAASQPISPLTSPATRGAWYSTSPDTSITAKIDEMPKSQAYCTTCDRYFKNASALNGHMRCHGGFLKKGKEKDGKKSPVRKSSSDMGPPLRRPPHTSTPSPQPTISRTSPTMGTPITFVPATLVPMTTSQADHKSTIEVVSVGQSTDQHLQNLLMKTDVTLVNSVLPQQKHKHLQEQLSSHILKRRMSGELQQRQQQQKPPQPPLQQLQSSQEHMRLLEEHIKQQQQHHHHMQDHSQQKLQLLSGHLLDDGSGVAVSLDSVSGRAASPGQGEHIQRLVESFQQVEEFQRQQQHQAELPQLSAEQLELIRQQHKLLGLPPLNPQQLQYQLHEEHNRLRQAQLQEQQLQEHHHLQGLDPGTLVMAAGPLTSQQLANAEITSALSVSCQPISLSGHHTLVQLAGQPGEDVDCRSSMPSQVALNTSVQQILAALDPAVVSAAGINLADHQHLLAQLQKQQQGQQLYQSDIMGMHIQPSVARLGIGDQTATLITGQVPGIHVSHLPQILLQPPDPDELNGVPTISIPESVVLGTSSNPVLQSSILESEQQQIERIQNGLMASVEKQHQQHAITAALSHPNTAHSLAAGPLAGLHLDQAIPNFLNVQSTAAQLQSPLDTQPNYGRLGEGPGQDNSMQQQPQPQQQQQQQQQEPQSFLSVMSSTPSCISFSSASSSSSSSTASKSTEAAVAQILKNISNSLAESSGQLGDNSDMMSSRGLSSSSSLEHSVDRTHVYQSFQGYSSSFSKSFKDSIKQDVMLSSTVDSDMGHLSTYPNDPLVRNEVPYSLKPARVRADGHNNKRRLSADLESNRTNSSFFAYKPHSGISPHSMLVNPLEVEGLIPGRARVRSKSGDINYKYMRSKSVDNSTMRPRSFTEDSLFRSNKKLDGTFISAGKASTPEQELFSRSDGAGVFRNPSTLPTSLKIKRKHRPAPLYIPPQFGIFQSRLRSPRVIGKESHMSSERGRGHTPPPYTPPPMLSPFRSGSGLFCTLHTAQPQTPRSAPVSGRVLTTHRGSFGLGRVDVNFSLTPDQTLDDDDVPETDTQAHINIGADYQAVLPELRARPWLAASYDEVNDKRNLLWEPSSQGDSTDSQMQCYQDLSCSAAVKGNGCNVEYALHLLNLAKGDLSEAMLMLMADPPMLPVGHPMLDYKYQESDSWNSNEMERFYRSIMIHDKDFFKVSKDVGTKSVKQCVQFYYVWKKVCPDDYRRLRLSRSKQNDYNTRRSAVKATTTAATAVTDKVSPAPPVSEPQSILANVVVSVEATEENVESVDSDNTSLVSDNDEASVALDSIHNSAPNTASSTPTRIESPAPLPPPQFSCPFEGCNVTCSSKQSLKRHQRKHQEKPHASPSGTRKPRPTTPSRSPVYDQFGDEVFPCRICGRVFAKVKSRSAHMKSHKIAEQAQQEKKAAEMVITGQAFTSV